MPEAPEALIVLDSRRALTTGKNAGMFPIKIHVTFVERKKGKKVWVPKDYPTGHYSESIEELNLIISVDGLPRGASKRLVNARKASKALETKANDILKNIQDRRTFEVHYLSNGNITEIEGFFNNKVKTMEDEGSFSTAEKYKSALNVIKKFTGGFVSFGEINEEWLKRFKKWYLSKGYSLASFAFHARALRHIFNQAIAIKVVNRDIYPFGRYGFKIPSVRRSIKRYFDSKEKDIFIRYRSGNDALNKYHDYWVFSYFCNGMNPADVAGLKRKDIFHDYILYERKKTENSDQVKKKIVIALSDDSLILKIIAKRGNPTLAPNEYVFPILTHDMTDKQKFIRVRNFVRKTNAALEDIRKELNTKYPKLFTSKFTSYSARHTNSNMMLQAGASTELIQDLLGHADKRTTQNYLDGFTLDIKKKFSKKL